MQRIFDVLEKSVGTQGVLNKIKLLAMSMNDDLEEFLRLSFDDTVYGISTKTIENAIGFKCGKDYEDIGALVRDKGSGNLTINDIGLFKDMLYVLKNKTGDELSNEITYMFAEYDPQHLKWLFRVVMHDLRNGVSWKTCNKVFMQLHMEPIVKFGVQLCGSIDIPPLDEFYRNHIDEYYDLVQKILEDKFEKEGVLGYGTKYDGFRLVVQKNGNHIVMRSRKGNLVNYFPELREHLLEKYPENVDFTIDGEIIGDKFSDIAKRSGRKSENIDKMDSLKYIVFDMLKYDGHHLDVCPLWERKKYIEDVIKTNGIIDIEDYKTTDDVRDIVAFFRECVEEGKEGVIIKLVDAPYENDSRNNFFKLKPFYEHTFKVVGYVFGNGKNCSKISVLKVQDASGNVCSDVGSGLTEDDMELFTRFNSESKDDVYVDVAYNEISMNADGKLSLRNPRFRKYRDDKDCADSLSLDSQYRKNA